MLVIVYCGLQLVLSNTIRIGDIDIIFNVVSSQMEMIHSLVRKPPCYHHELFLMWLGCHRFPNEIDPMMSFTWLSICASVEFLFD